MLLAMPDDPVPTTERLALALEAAGDRNLTPLIEKARAGFYDDYKSPLAFPIIRLVTDLSALGHEALAERAKAGDFDATREEAKAWAKSDEAQALLRGIAR